jgi:hypothetical protein
VVTVFFNPDVKEDINIQVSKVLKFRRSSRRISCSSSAEKRLCLKQAPRLWNDAVNATLHVLNFIAVILTLVYM